jgi:hypothetical protein
MVCALDLYPEQYHHSLAELSLKPLLLWLLLLLLVLVLVLWVLQMLIVLLAINPEPPTATHSTPAFFVLQNYYGKLHISEIILRPDEALQFDQVERDVDCMDHKRCHHRLYNGADE